MDRAGQGPTYKADGVASVRSLPEAPYGEAEWSGSRSVIVDGRITQQRAGLNPPRLLA